MPKPDDIAIEVVDIPGVSQRMGRLDADGRFVSEPHPRPSARVLMPPTFKCPHCARTFGEGMHEMRGRDCQEAVGLRVLQALKALPVDWRERVLWELVEGSEADTVAEIRGVQSVPDLVLAGELWNALQVYFSDHPIAPVVDGEGSAL